MTYNARTECMRGWLISNAYVGIKRSSKQSGAGASTFRRRRGVCSPTLRTSYTPKSHLEQGIDCQLISDPLFIIFVTINYSSFFFLHLKASTLPTAKIRVVRTFEEITRIYEYFMVCHTRLIFHYQYNMNNSVHISK